ncbi:hypothetical protein [Methylobacterium oxalidis]|uniref:hypothetical protein n=1 Tax=Methylobacterium oxalidis TaxID=944322 RepID=UPI003314E7A1
MSRDNAASLFDGHAADSHSLKSAQSAVVFRQVGASGKAKRPGRGGRSKQGHQRKYSRTDLQRHSRYSLRPTPTRPLKALYSEADVSEKQAQDLPEIMLRR